MKEPIYLPIEIRNYRDSLNLSQDSFGRKYNRSGKAVCSWEMGISRCPLQVFIDVINWLYKLDVNIKEDLTK
jgi:transcriptional regulator with XRE-family HTH domain